MACGISVARHLNRVSCETGGVEFLVDQISSCICLPCNDAGTTETELVDLLNTAITESGCPGEQWAMIALKTYGDLHAGKKVDAAEICCRDENPN